jgi:hypothetical protein
MASKSSIYYRTHSAARKKKIAYDSEYEKSEKRVKYRVALNRIRRKRHLKGDPRDISHGKDGSLRLENRSRNRGRNGADGRSTLR